MDFSNRNLGRYGLVAVIAFYFLIIAAASWFFPRANWDMVAYTAVAIEDDYSSAADLHAAAWSAVSDRISKGELVVLTEDRQYRVDQYADPDAFESMLPFYRIKVLYVEAASLLAEFMQPVDALRLISTFSVLAIGVICLIWVWPSARLPDALLILPLVVLSDVGYLGQYVVPDLFSTVFLLAGVLLWLRGASWLAILPSLLAILARPDHVAFIGLWALAGIVTRTGWKPMVVMLVLALPTYLVTSVLADHPGWWVHFYFSNIEMVSTIEGFHPAFSPIAYIGAIVKGAVRSLVTESWWAVFCVEVLAAGFIVFQWRKVDARIITIVGAAMLTIPAKFFIAPMWETRFYTGYLIMIGLCLLGPFHQALRNSSETRSAT
ncbi:hypothetical protein [Notoacmeibacter ruber]|uniref:DUF2029 domain-containing protein n=1 Tax=Notoacmeibacter ruber TaxID=2670375 RepID=A0A3L7JDV4_9HYPH|nr:hypothetical protein [Notoacmeibacter ruber]RLQ88853.1 hypothetical protein D8780_12100 [Notoacmeibacter ruber]